MSQISARTGTATFLPTVRSDCALGKTPSAPGVTPEGQVAAAMATPSLSAGTTPVQAGAGLPQAGAGAEAPGMLHLQTALEETKATEGRAPANIPVPA